MNSLLRAYITVRIGWQVLHVLAGLVAIYIKVDSVQKVLGSFLSWVPGFLYSLKKLSIYKERG